MKNKVMLCAMVKANAYSHGAKCVASTIQEYVDYFGVATVNEGIELRKCGVTKPILCVGAILDAYDYKSCNKYSIDVTVHDLHSLSLIENIKNKLRVQIKIDTGMHRLGFNSKDEFLLAYNKLKNNKNITIAGIFSHFVQSEDNKSNKTKEQFDEFLHYCVECDTKNTIFHISNSHGIRFKNYNLNMCRCGLAIYGYGNVTGLKPVLKITSRIIAIHYIKAGESVGYNAKYVAKQDEIVATVAFGYADGMDMRFSGFFVKIGRKKYEIIGKICMDMFMIKADCDVKIGDEVIILDNAQELASFSGKSVYEILSNFKSNRAKIIIE